MDKSESLLKRGTAQAESHCWIQGVRQCLLKGQATISPDVKRSRREADLSPPSSAEIKNEWGYTSASPVCFRGVDRDVFSSLSRLQRSALLTVYRPIKSIVGRIVY